MSVAQIKAEAKALGLKSYSTGKPCKFGHVSPRSTINSTCLECCRMKYAGVAAKRVVQMAAWRAANPDTVKAACKRWKDANPDAVKTHRYARRARKANGAGFNIAQVRAVLAAQGGRCANCRKLVGENFHADHVVPLALGGIHDIKNIQILCPPCNHRKHKKDPIVWARENGRLL